MKKLEAVQSMDLSSTIELIPVYTTVVPKHSASLLIQKLHLDFYPLPLSHLKRIRSCQGDLQGKKKTYITSILHNSIL